jgi:RimJ/RimL family protein N-acetyltransferase
MMMAMQGVTTRDLTDADVSVLWEAAVADAAWPVHPPTEAAFRRAVAGLRASALFGQGDIQAVLYRGELAGFCSLQEVPPQHLGPAAIADGPVLEAGTYLLPWARGRGLNPEVKRHLLTSAFTRHQASWCVFLIARDNQAARRAFTKLSWPYHIEMEEDGGRFARLLHRRAWEEGRDFIAYAIHRDDFRTAP